MQFLHDAADAYAREMSSPLSDVLHENETATLAHHPKAVMHSGRLQGLFLQMVSNMIRPRYVLEIGTFTGFSALCLAAGLHPEGELHTLEIREEDAKTAAGYFKKAGEKRIKLHVGEAREIIKTLDKQWDLIFIDADKTGYIEYYELTLPQLKPGGFILADNVLFHGEVLELPLSGKNAQAIDQFNRHVKRDNRVEQVLLTIRDGLMLVRKK